MVTWYSRIPEDTSGWERGTALRFDGKKFQRISDPAGPADQEIKRYPWYPPS
ncbi:hypothetical protein [Taibaiella helva]|uniref:hypothetical protein n=1 Tax=Taibaiella helva TaxID=2301235 RepID=UPI0018E4EB18|nr:hypothetical protein [Taibaiella helva]